jgi:VanZ like family
VDSAPINAIPAGPTADPPATRSGLHRFRLAMAIVWTFVIMTLCWIPGRMVHDLEDGSRWFKIPDLDKVVHAGIFVIFSLLWARLGTSRRRLARVVLGGFGLAIITELVQRLAIVGRDGSVADTIVDFAGVLVGVVAVPLIEPLARFVEARIFREAVSQPGPANGTTVSVAEGARTSQ